MTVNFRNIGIRIGTIIPVAGYSYCADDNTHWPVIHERPAMACPLDWAPRPTTRTELADDLYSLLFG